MPINSALSVTNVNAARDISVVGTRIQAHSLTRVHAEEANEGGKNVDGESGGEERAEVD